VTISVIMAVSLVLPAQYGARFLQELEPYRIGESHSVMRLWDSARDVQYRW